MLWLFLKSKENLEHRNLCNLLNTQLCVDHHYTIITQWMSIFLRVLCTIVHIICYRKTLTFNIYISEHIWADIGCRGWS
jgi:hypothetical protein